MNGLLDDLVSSLAHHVQTAPQTFQAVASAAAAAAANRSETTTTNTAHTHRTRRKRGQGSSSSYGVPPPPQSSSSALLFWNQPALPPKSLDLIYITDRIIASSEPALAPHPTFDDRGRDQELKISSSLLAAAKRRVSATPVNDEQQQKRRVLFSAVSTLSSSSSSGSAPDPSGQDACDNESSNHAIAARGIAEDETQLSSLENPQEGGEASDIAFEELSNLRRPQHQQQQDESHPLCLQEQGLLESIVSRADTLEDEEEEDTIGLALSTDEDMVEKQQVLLPMNEKLQDSSTSPEQGSHDKNDNRHFEHATTSEAVSTSEVEHDVGVGTKKGDSNNIAMIEQTIESFASESSTQSPPSPYTTNVILDSSNNNNKDVDGKTDTAPTQESEKVNTSLDTIGGASMDDKSSPRREGNSTTTSESQQQINISPATRKSTEAETHIIMESIEPESPQIRVSLDMDVPPEERSTREREAEPLAPSSVHAPSSSGRFSPISEIDSDFGNSDIYSGASLPDQDGASNYDDDGGMIPNDRPESTAAMLDPNIQEELQSKSKQSADGQSNPLEEVDNTIEGSDSNVTDKASPMSHMETLGGGGEGDSNPASSMDPLTIDEGDAIGQPSESAIVESDGPKVHAADSPNYMSTDENRAGSSLVPPQGEKAGIYPMDVTLADCGPDQLRESTTTSPIIDSSKPLPPIEMSGPQTPATKTIFEQSSSPPSPQANVTQQQANAISVGEDELEKGKNEWRGDAFGTRTVSDVASDSDDSRYQKNLSDSDSASFPQSTELQSIDESIGELESSTGPPISETEQDHPAPTPIVKNSPATIASYLEQRHGKNHFLGYSLSDRPPDDRTLVLLRRQIVQLGWWSPCPERSETPSIPKLLQVCYALHAYLQLDSANVVWVYCANGKTRTAIAIACYLKFVGLVDRSSDGFLHFLSQRGISNPEGTLRQLPPSLHIFFRQFDSVLELGGFLNRKPLLLRAITLQGIPVEDKPCLDIWDNMQRHIYSSHPEMWPQQERESGAFHSPTKNNINNTITSQWADEEGFYRVNVVLDGDFLLLCRFGGDFADESTIHDPSKILFRYANTTGMLSGGCPYELPPSKVDLMRRYAHSLDDDEFLVTLLFEAHWDGGLTSDDHIPVEVARQLASRSMALPSSGDGVWRSHERAACEEGWKIIVDKHSARPSPSDVEGFTSFCGQSNSLTGCADHLISLALQLTNFNYNQAAPLLVDTSSPLAWWQPRHAQGDQQTPGITKLPEQRKQRPHESDMAVDTEETQNILDILDQIDLESHLHAPDLDHFVRQDSTAWARDEHKRVPRISDSLLATPRKRGGRSLRSSDVEDQQHHAQNLIVLGSACLKDSGWMVPSMMVPRQGDVMRAFGPYYEQLHAASVPPRSLETSIETSLTMSRPSMPLFARGRTSFLPPPPPSTNRPKRDNYEETNFRRYDPHRNASEELLQQLRHTGVNMDGLLNLAKVSQHWGLEPMSVEQEHGDSVETAESADDLRQANSLDSIDSKTMNREAKEQQQKKWEDAQRAELKEKEENRKVEIEKRKTLEPNAGQGEQKKEGDAKKNGESEKEENQQKVKDTKVKDAESKKEEKEQGKETNSDDLPLKDDPDYAKYFKMLKMGMAKEQVVHALQRDSKDPFILDMDPDKSLMSQRPDEAGGDKGEVPLKDHPEYSKYFKMINMGLPIGAVKNSLGRDGKDPSIMDLDPNKSLKSQTQEAAKEGDGPPLKDDPEYAKYYKMLSMGLPMGAVKNALTKDGKDPAVMDLDPNKSFKSQVSQGDSDDGPPLKDDPDYAKYFKMLTMGLPMGAVKNAIGRDGKDAAVMDLDPNKSLKSQMGGTDADDGPPLKEDSEFSKYFKMLTMGLPMGAVKNAVSRDGKDPAIMDLDPGKSLKSQTGGGGEEKDTGIPLKDDPEYSKYFKMMGMGLPMGALKNALERDGKDPGVMDLDHNKSVAFQMKKKGAASKKAAAKKKKRVRRKKIYWNPIDPGKLKEGSMWSIVRDSIKMDKLNYDLKEFEELFTESADPADKKKETGTKKKEEKKSTQVIDGKRDMNGGIILTRLRTENEKIAEFVTKMYVVGSNFLVARLDV
jgi:hypothetical protein